MNSEQLNSARLARWSQNGEARLTLEAAAEWLDGIGFCSYLPAGSRGAAPTASFLEAVVGRPARIPSAGERSRAHELLARMVENSAAVPLKLGTLPAESPDSLASPEAFRYIYALRGNRNIKADPSTVGNEKVTPLALHCWQAIREHGPLDLPTLQSILGRDMTEAAMARSLQELWAALYVCPIPNAKGQPAQWEMLSRRFPQQVAAGAGTGQAEALSAVVSLYLYAVVGATEDEILTFLSPLAPQSKLREVIRGLGSMRQLDMIDIGGHAHLCLQGGLLPEMVAQLSEEQLSLQAGAATGNDGIEIEREQPPQPASRPGSYLDSGEAGKFAPKKFAPKKFVPRKFVPRDAGPGDFAPRRIHPGASGKRPDFERDAGFSRTRPAAGDATRGERFRPGARDARKPGGGPSAERGPGERARRWEKSGGRAGSGFQEKTFTSRPSFQRSGSKSQGLKSQGTKPWAAKDSPPRDGGEPRWPVRKPFGAGVPARRGGEQEERPRRWEKSGPAAAARPGAGSKPGGGRSYGAKSFGSKSGGAKPWTSRGAAFRTGPAKPYGKRTSGPSQGGKPWGTRPAATGEEGERPPRRESSESRSGDKPRSQPGAKPAAKPFWAKNPRGGKGSTPGSRTNRPRGGKAGKSGKKK